MKYFSYLLFAVVFISCNKKQEIKNEKISLNGTWQFFATDSVSEQNILENTSITWDSLTVPGNWDTTEKYSEYVGKGYYQRSFTVPESWKGKQIRVEFGAVYQTSKVWVNGKLLGTHVGGYTPFEYNITDNVVYGSENKIVVMANNTYKRGAWWAWGGISRDVTLKTNNDLRIVNQHITAVPNFKTQKIAFVIAYKVQNNGDVVESVTLTTDLSAEGNKMISKEQNIEITPNSIESYSIAFETLLDDFKLWDLESPNLYTAVTTLNNTVDVKQDNFGVRKIEAKGEQLLLNNKPLYANGLNRVHDHPDFGNTEPDSLVVYDMKDIMALGGRMSRLMHAPLSKNILDFCDANGFLLIEEIPVWGDDDIQTFKNNPQTKAWLKELITRDYNHPSVIGWSVGNELRQNDSIAPWGEKILTQDQFEYVNSMLDYVQELDSTRLKTYVGLTTYQGGNMTNEPYEKLDLICINSYSNAFYAVETTNLRFPNKPIFVSEIGLRQIGSAPDGELTEELVRQIQDLKELPYVVGSSLWSYNDYRSNYKGTPESGFREWGVVDEKRQPKKAYQQIKELYANE